MTKFAVILFAALALTFAGATALQAANPGPIGPPSYIRCLACKVPVPPAYPPPDCRRVPPRPVKCVTAKPSASSPTRIPPPGM
jgi:hypothetical protein